MTLGKPALTSPSVLDSSDLMVVSDRTVETLTMIQLWSVSITATLFTLFVLWAFHYAVRELRYELSWLGWIAISIGAFGLLGIPLLFGVEILFDLWLLTD